MTTFTLITTLAIIAALAYLLGHVMGQTAVGETARGSRPRASTLYDPGPSEMVLAMITAVSGVVKETYWVETEEKFEAAAETLIGMDAEPEHLAGFLPWWEANGYYTGRPALKTLIDEWRSFKAGVTKRPNSTNGTGPKPVPSAGLVQIEPGVY